MSSRDFSLVIVSLVGGPALERCLAALPVSDIECVAILASSEASTDPWLRRFPSVRFLPAAGEPVPVRRKRALSATSGTLVGMIEDTSVPAATWVAGARRAFLDPRTVAAGGPVTIDPTLPASGRALAWVEYGPFVPGAPPPRRPSGNNMAFRRAPLVTALGDDSAIFESNIFERLEASGEIAFDPDMTVQVGAFDSAALSLASRFHHGRLYSSERALQRGRREAIFTLLRAPLLPAVLTARIVERMHRSGAAADVLRLLPHVAMMETAWAFGEAAGAIAGRGSSLARWT